MKTGAKFDGILEQVKTSIASRVFTDLLSNSPKRSPRFSPGYEGTENMFYFFYKIIIFRLNKGKDDIRSAYYFLGVDVLGWNISHRNDIKFYLIPFTFPYFPITIVNSEWTSSDYSLVISPYLSPDCFFFVFFFCGTSFRGFCYIVWAKLLECTS